MTTRPIRSEARMTCPVCKRRTLAEHCPSPTCSWDRCRNQGCRAQLDFGRRIGFRPKAGGYVAITLKSKS